MNARAASATAPGQPGFSPINRALLDSPATSSPDEGR